MHWTQRSFGGLSGDRVAQLAHGHGFLSWWYLAGGRVFLFLNASCLSSKAVWLEPIFVTTVHLGWDTHLCQRHWFSVRDLKMCDTRVCSLYIEKGIRLWEDVGRPALVHRGRENWLKCSSLVVLFTSVFSIFSLLETQKSVYFKLFPLNYVDLLSTLLEVMLRRWVEEENMTSKCIYCSLTHNSKTFLE